MTREEAQKLVETGEGYVCERVCQARTVYYWHPEKAGEKLDWQKRKQIRKPDFYYLTRKGILVAAGMKDIDGDTVYIYKGEK